MGPIAGQFWAGFRPTRVAHGGPPEVIRPDVLHKCIPYNYESRTEHTMPCTASGPCSCTPGCPLPQGTSGSLGFVGVKPCCRVPCPSFPLHKVVICIALNEVTAVKIQQGCGTNSPLLTAELESDCTIDWSWGQVYTTDGRKCQVVNWTRTVTDGSYIRLKFCRADDCDDACEPDYNSCGTKIVNALLKFQVDGVNTVSYLQKIAETGGYDCYRVECRGECCEEGDVVHLNDIRPGTVIQYGPIGTSTPTPRPLPPV